MSVILLFFSVATANSGEIRIVNKEIKGGFTISKSDKAAPVIVEESDAEVVSIAARLFCNDVKMVTGIRPEIKNNIEEGMFPIVIGTLGKSKIIDTLASNNKIKTVKVRDKWETFGIAVVRKPFKGVQKALVVFGSDPRGTAFGILELSRMIGVSPWSWWADVIPKKQNTVCVTEGSSVYGPPSVKYRGLFINDEDWGLQPWAARHLDKDVNDIGPHTYEKVMELMLRLKSNLLWPAMHPCTKAFWYYKDNVKLAQRYDIVLGSSHCEQMLRNNVDEWTHNFPFEYGRLPGNYSWKTNSETIKKYWADRVEESKNNNAIYSLGMRGIHDSGLPGYKSAAERRNALIDIIKCQREMLGRTFGSADKVPQVFCPYKEALPLYRMGLELPDDITLLWVDDNFSYIRQLSDPKEQKRKGGGGVYYHFSYWGIPQDWLWLGSTPPALTVYELSKAYAMNCKDIWVFNVGDIKPIEYELQYAMDFSWNVKSIDMDNADLYGKKWGAETFGPQFADEIYEIKKEYYRLASAGKPEHINRVDYTQFDMEKRLSDYHLLVERSRSLQTKIPSELQDAYYELIAYPVEASSAMNDKVLGSRLSYIYALDGLKDKTMTNSKLSKEGYRNIVALTERYNKHTAGGKWDGIMDYAPRGVKHFYEFKTADTVDIAAKTKINIDSSTVIKAVEYARLNCEGTSFKTIKGLGISGEALTVWPLNMRTFESKDIMTAPYAEYKVPVRKGKNIIEVRCLPTFPIYNGLKLRYAVSVDNDTPQFVNITAEAETNKNWGPNVMRGYSFGKSLYTSDKDKTINVRIYFSDPGLVISELHVK